MLGDLEEGIEKPGFDDLVSVGQEGVGVAKGEEMLACRCPVIDFAMPLPDNYRSPRRFRDLYCPLPVAYFPEKGQFVDEDK